MKARPFTIPWIMLKAHPVAVMACAGCAHFVLSMLSCVLTPLFSMSGVIGHRAAQVMFLVIATPGSQFLKWLDHIGVMRIDDSDFSPGLFLFALLSVLLSSVFWGIAAGLVWWPLYRKWVVPRWRTPAWCCPACGYDLRGSAHSDTCPECGAAIPGSEVKS